MEIQVVETIVLVVHVLAALAIIGLVLLQQGRGSDMGSGFGGGASNTVFGSGGSGNFMTRLTTTIAITFFFTSFGLAYFAKEHSMDARSVGIPTVQQSEAPAADREGADAADNAPGAASEEKQARASEAEVPAVVEPSESEIPEG